jgi:hypothetical protein
MFKTKNDYTQSAQWPAPEFAHTPRAYSLEPATGGLFDSNKTKKS